MSDQPPLLSLEQARISGLPRYFTGKPCKHGHIAERCTKYSRCLECEVGRNRIRAGWGARNREKAKEMQDRYRRTDKYRVIKKATESRRCALERGAAGERLPRNSLPRMIRKAKVCPDCKRKFTKVREKSVDHVTALAKGGRHEIRNLRIICKPCNSSKGARPFASSGQGLLI